MTQSIRDAAQALLDAIDSRLNDVVPYEQVAGLRAALSAPQPAADERVAEHMAKVTDIAVVTRHHFGYADKMRQAFEAVEQSARALLSASQEDAEHAAMYRWIREHGEPDAGMAYRPDWTAEMYDAAIRAAMSSKETK